MRKVNKNPVDDADRVYKIYIRKKGEGAILSPQTTLSQHDFSGREYGETIYRYG